MPLGRVLTRPYASPSAPLKEEDSITVTFLPDRIFTHVNREVSDTPPHVSCLVWSPGCSKNRATELWAFQGMLPCSCASQSWFPWPPASESPSVVKVQISRPVGTAESELLHFAQASKVFQNHFHSWVSKDLVVSPSSKFLSGWAEMYYFRVIFLEY